MSKQNGQSKNGQSGGKSGARTKRAQNTSAARRQQTIEQLIKSPTKNSEFDDLPDPVRALLSEDFPLSNISRQDRKYLRLKAENLAIYVKEQHPPSDSLVQGETGAVLLEDPDYDTTALDAEMKNRIESLNLASFVRNARAVGGWQQDKLNENVQTKRVEDGRVQEEEDGLFSGLLS
jgi:hypothetical protein